MRKLSIHLPTVEAIDFLSIFDSIAGKEPNESCNVKVAIPRFASEPADSVKQRSFEGFNELIITLGSAGAITVLGKIIKAYLENRKTEITIRSGKKEIIISGRAKDLNQITDSVNRLLSKGKQDGRKNK